MDSHFHGNDIRSNEIAALSSKVCNDRSLSGITNVGVYCNAFITNNIYLQMGEICKTCGKIPS